MANRIMLNQTSYHGAGAIAEIVTEAKAHAFQKAFVCSDPDLIKFGVTGKVTGLLDKEGLAYEVYSDIKANPTIDNVKNGVAAFKASGADYIIAIGGGSSMDTSKAIGIIIYRDVDDALIRGVLDRIINQVKDNRVNGWLKALHFDQVITFKTQINFFLHCQID